VDLPERRKTALNSIHRQLGARMVDFVGWDMPVQYEGPIPEHMAVRTRAGIFDVSHMGEIEIQGSGALDTIRRVACNDAARLAVGQCQYSALTTPTGTFVDDVLVYRRGFDRFFLCVNASNSEKDFRWIQDHAAPATEISDRSDEFSQIAIQGPRALDIVQTLTALRVHELRSYWFLEGDVEGTPAIVSRTGYTGEDGFEIYVPPRAAETIWLRSMEAGRPLGLKPAGLAARNTLRLEAKMALYGNDIDETTTVLEADMAWICKLDRDFIGRDALLLQQGAGVRRILAGLEMVERGIAREGYPIRIGDRAVGTVTSGSPAPFLQKNIALAYLPAEHSAIGTEVSVVIRERPAKARVVQTPFYKRKRSG
jgi:aminomethyltransferase